MIKNMTGASTPGHVFTELGVCFAITLIFYGVLFETRKKVRIYALKYTEL